MAIFEFITKGASTLDHSKLPPFACFLLTLMKLRLHIPITMIWHLDLV